eukprot:4701403-Amphidinium_carterae.2
MSVLPASVPYLRPPLPSFPLPPFCGKASTSMGTATLAAYCALCASMGSNTTLRASAQACNLTTNKKRCSLTFSGAK